MEKALLIIGGLIIVFVIGIVLGAILCAIIDYKLKNNQNKNP